MKEGFVTPTDLARTTGQRPQAIYNLIRQGYISAQKEVVQKEVLVISESEAQRYAEGYLERKAERESKS